MPNVVSRAKPARDTGRCSINWTLTPPEDGLQPLFQRFSWDSVQVRNSGKPRRSFRSILRFNQADPKKLGTHFECRQALRFRRPIEKIDCRSWMTASQFLGSVANGWFRGNRMSAFDFPPGFMRFRRTPAMCLLESPS